MAQHPFVKKQALCASAIGNSSFQQDFENYISKAHTEQFFIIRKSGRSIDGIKRGLQQIKAEESAHFEC
ncbi:hypothetical protein [Polaromonas sp. CG9_12]|nr:hypothetical protein [Polaromonas sp. CG9_12]